MCKQLLLCRGCKCHVSWLCCGCTLSSKVMLLPLLPLSSLASYFHLLIPSLSSYSHLPPPLLQLPSSPSNAQNVNIKDFRQSWSDGLAFCAILHSFLPDKIPYDDLTADNPRENFTIAFEAAKYVGNLLSLIPRLFVACSMKFTHRIIWSCSQTLSKTLKVWDQTKYYLHCQQ